MQTTKESRNMSTEEILTNNKPRDRKWLELTLLDNVIGKDTVELYHSVTAVTFFITTVPVPLNVVTTGRPVAKQKTVGPLLR
ncbi:hypothetical protein Tco_0946340 [Tanacetum coccineum]